MGNYLNCSEFGNVRYEYVRIIFATDYAHKMMEFLGENGLIHLDEMENYETSKEYYMQKYEGTCELEKISRNLKKQTLEPGYEDYSRQFIEFVTKVKMSSVYDLSFDEFEKEILDTEKKLRDLKGVIQKMKDEKNKHEEKIIISLHSKSLLKRDQQTVEDNDTRESEGDQEEEEEGNMIFGSISHSDLKGFIEQVKSTNKNLEVVYRKSSDFADSIAEEDDDDNKDTKNKKEEEEERYIFVILEKNKKKISNEEEVLSVIFENYENVLVVQQQQVKEIDVSFNRKMRYESNELIRRTIFERYQVLETISSKQNLWRKRINREKVIFLTLINKTFIKEPEEEPEEEEDYYESLKDRNDGKLISCHGWISENNLEVLKEILLEKEFGDEDFPPKVEKIERPKRQQQDDGEGNNNTPKRYVPFSLPSKSSDSKQVKIFNFG